MDYTDAFLEELLGCRKEITEPPKRDFTIGQGMKRNGMKMRCNKGREFLAFMRVSEAFQENFSIGLKYLSTGGDGITLLRCNGPHGDYLDPNAQPHWHADFHFHKATEANIKDGLKPEAGGTVTTEYASYNQALRYFLRTCNIEWSESHFPALRQMELNMGDSE